MRKDYTIGLDIGTNSVGYAVSFDDYRLASKKFKVLGNTEKSKVKKNMWGVRLFEDGQTAQSRRMNRTARRRYTRRKQRLTFLQEIFAEEMEKVDDNFFHRLQESFYVPGEKVNTPYPIFGTLEEEKDYHEKFPTIYHLRKYLADTNEKVDLRLVYLAMSHIMKYRGHFLIEGNLDAEDTAIDELFDEFLKEYILMFSNEEISSFRTSELLEKAAGIFTQKSSKAKKAEMILGLFPTEKKNGTFDQFIKLIVGNQGNFKNSFNLAEDQKLTFSDEEFDAKLEDLLGLIGDDFAEIFLKAQNLYSAIVLANIITTKEKTNAKLSASMIKRYTEHKEDLQMFKALIKRNAPEKYGEVFKDESKSGYSGYIRHAKQVSQENFYKYVMGILKDLPESTEKTTILEKINRGDFLRKQRTFDNGAIPHQVHCGELMAIIDSQKEFYPFLAEEKEHINQTFNFRIPYYIGPLGQGKGKFSWLTRNSSEKITPWNIKEVVDFDTSAEAFIRKMTNKDSYLPEEDVLPKRSLLYQKYIILNELTKITYEDERGNKNNFSKEEKKVIFNKLFKENLKFNQKKLEKFLAYEFHLENILISGLEEAFNGSYSTYHDLKKIKGMQEILDNPENEEIIEDVIKILTLFEDKKMIARQLENYQNIFTTEQIKELSRKKYTGWGRLSEKLINGIKDQNTKKTILDYLMDDDGPKKNLNRNFMQLINDDDLSFKTQIAKAQKAELTDNLHEMVQNLAGSPAIKKGIFQSLKIVEELVEIMGYEPKNIVVEMARENQTTAKGKKKSTERLKNLQGALKDFGSDILDPNVTNEDLKKDRLYLYYLQNGKDMYTGKQLEIDNLSNYDIDHIIPQSFTTDNSFDNRVLTAQEINRGKKDDVPSKEVVERMLPFWNHLYNANLISKVKLDHLKKGLTGGLTEADKAGFIKRQLVETRQITKNVAAILDQMFNKSEEKKVQVITLKSALTSQFRKNFELYKVREINDHHHAHDAYLNSVVAITLLKVYPKLKPEFVYGEYQHFNSFKENKATAKKQFYSNIMRFFTQKEKIVDTSTDEILWDRGYTINIVRKTLDYHQVNVVKKVEIQTGSLTNETVYPKGESAKLIPRKTKNKYLNPKKYGGFNSPTNAYSLVVKHLAGKSKKEKKSIVGITLREQNVFENSPLVFLENKGYVSPKIIAYLPKYTLFEFDDGRKRMVSGESESQKGNQMILPIHLVKFLYHAQHYDEIKYPKSVEYITQNKNEFTEILKLINNFSEVNIKADKNLNDINTAYENNLESNLGELSQSFVNLMTFTKSGAPADFNFLGEKINRKRYTSLTELIDATVVFQSVTGLYETRLDMRKF